MKTGLTTQIWSPIKILIVLSIALFVSGCASHGGSFFIRSHEPHYSRPYYHSAPVHHYPKYQKRHYHHPPAFHAKPKHAHKKPHPRYQRPDRYPHGKSMRFNRKHH